MEEKAKSSGQWPVKDKRVTAGKAVKTRTHLSCLPVSVLLAFNWPLTTAGQMLHLAGKPAAGGCETALVE